MDKLSNEATLGDQAFASLESFRVSLVMLKQALAASTAIMDRRGGDG